MLKSILNTFSHYLEDRVNIIKLGIVERMAVVMSFTMFMMLIMFLMIAVVIFIGIGLGLYIGDILDSPTGGYFATAGITMLFLLLFFLMKKTLLKSFAGIFINLLTDDIEEIKEDN